jgi:hypothetical protein
MGCCDQWMNSWMTQNSAKPLSYIYYIVNVTLIASYEAHQLIEHSGRAAVRTSSSGLHHPYSEGTAQVQTVYQTKCNHDISSFGINMHNTEDALGPHKHSNTSSCVLPLYTQRLHTQHSATHSICKTICNQRHYSNQ